MKPTTESQRELIGLLSADDDWRARRRAALALAGHRQQGSFEALVGALDDRDEDVRHAAIVALGHLGDPRAVDVLGRPRTLEDSCADIRWATVKTLGRLGTLATANVLSRALEDPEWVVRNQALLVLSDLIRDTPEAVDGEQVKVLIRLLTIEDQEVHEQLVDALARRSTRCLDEMHEALRGPSRRVRAGVAEAMGSSRDPRAVPMLVEALDDAVPEVRREAIRGLGRLGDPRAVEALVVTLADRHARVAEAAVEALGRLGAAATMPLCSSLAHAHSKVHRRNVVLALGEGRDPRAVIHLLNCLSSTYYVVRRAAIAALTGYGVSVVEALIEMVETVELPVDELMRPCMDHSNKRLRLRAIRALGELKNTNARKPLRVLREDPDRDIADAAQEALSKIGLAAWARHGAVIALGNIGDPRAVHALTHALWDHSEYVRAQAARALARMADEKALESLVNVLSWDEHQWVRREAAAALRVSGCHTQRVIAAFEAALTDESWEVRAEAARALGRLDEPDSVPRLLAALEDSTYTVMICAVNALANLERHSTGALLELAAGDDCPRRQPAIKALLEAAEKELLVEVEALLSCPPRERRPRVEKLRERWV